MKRSLLACRLDNIGDVVLTGPAVRALAEGARVVMLASPSGAQAARLLPGVDDVIEFDAPWVGYAPTSVDARHIGGLVDLLRSRSFDEAVVFTSFHQSSLPLALLLRMAGIARITAISEDYPGALLDVRCSYRRELHEVEQNLEVAASAGFDPQPQDDLRLQLRLPDPTPAVTALPDRYVVVHPGASVAARALPAPLARDACDGLARSGREVVVTGDAREAAAVSQLVERLGGGVRSLAGTLTLTELCHVIARAEAIVCGNTGPAHLAAAVGTPVVELFAAVVDPARWRPWRVAHRLLGDPTVPCSGCRARVCPRHVQVCVSNVTSHDVLTAVREVVAERRGVPA